MPLNNYQLNRIGACHKQKLDKWARGVEVGDSGMHPQQPHTGLFGRHNPRAVKLALAQVAKSRQGSVNTVCPRANRHLPKSASRQSCGRNNPIHSPKPLGQRQIGGVKKRPDHCHHSCYSAGKPSHIAPVSVLPNIPVSSAPGPDSANWRRLPPSPDKATGCKPHST